MNMHKLPNKISEYILNNFFYGYLTNVKSVKKKDGQVIYYIILHENGKLHHLKFLKDGYLIRDIMEPLQEDYYFD
jgi:hypothetical protein